MPGSGEGDARTALAAAWPPTDAPGTDHRRASLVGTDLVAATWLPGGGALALALGGEPGGWSVVPVVRDGAGGGWRRARPGDGAAAGLVRALAAGGSLGGGFAFQPGPAGRPDGSGRGVERALGTDQTNETVIVDERLGVKWLVHPDPRRERAPRLLRHLAAAGFRELPPLLGTLAWRATPDAEAMTVAMLGGWLPAARDGWDWGVDGVLAHATPAHACSASCPARFAPDVGALVARLHLALATPTDVIPEPVGTAGQDTIDGWAEAARRALVEAIELTAADDPGAAADLRAMRLDDALAGLGPVSATTVQPVHGDLHVGQVLAGPHGLAVVDLDGNPTSDAATIQAPAPAARDVAGMLCSLDHVGRIAIRRGAPASVVQAWIAGACDAFLGAYRAALGAAGRPDLLDERLLEPFWVEQECRELIYAARFLPRWRYAPMGALRARAAR